MAAIDNVPDEIIRQILEYVPPAQSYDDILLLSKRFKRIAFEPLLWKHYCQISFRYWHADHRLSEKLAARASKTDWRELWKIRQYRNDLCARLLDHIIATKVGRMEKVARICRFGYDAKDFLLEQIQTPDTAEDALARRYEMMPFS